MSVVPARFSFFRSLSGLLHQLAQAALAQMVLLCWADSSMLVVIRIAKFVELTASNMLAVTNVAICVNLALIVSVSNLVKEGHRNACAALGSRGASPNNSPLKSRLNRGGETQSNRGIEWQYSLCLDEKMCKQREAAGLSGPYSPKECRSVHLAPTPAMRQPVARPCTARR